MLVPVRVNGRDFEFLVDTGSAYTGLSSATVAHLRLALRAGGGRRIAPAHGGTVRVPTVTLDQLSVGGHRVQGLVVIALDLPDELQIDGLLGMDYLGRFRVTLESDTATLVLRSTQRR